MGKPLLVRLRFFFRMVHRFRLVLTFIVIGTALTLLPIYPSLASTSLNSNTTYYISAPSGGDCASIGTWDSAVSTCTLNTDITVNGVDGIHVDSDGIILDGGAHTLTGSNTSNTNGVYGSGRTGVTIKNLTVQHFSYGISLNSSGSILSNSNILSGNTTSSNSWDGIDVEGSDNTISGNTTNSNSQDGIYV